MKKLFISLLFLLAFAATGKVNAQNINPQSQINWSHSSGCATLGASYNPDTNTCVVPLLPIAPGGAQNTNELTVTGSLFVVNTFSSFINNVVEAQQFTGADACTQLYNANVYAIAHNIPKVDATGFVGTVACNANPFLSLNSTIGANVHLTVEFGTTHFQSTVPWEITNSGISLLGAGPFSTQVEYTGSSCTSSPATCAVLHADTDGGSGAPATNGGVNGLVIRDMSFYGGAANITDAVILNASRSRFDNIYAYGATTCGIRLHGAETNTVTHPVVSQTAAFFMGIQNSGHTVPANGLCMDEDTAHGTLAVTATTISDPVMEFVSAIGIDCIGCNNVVITGGTSEDNGTGSSAGAGLTVGVHSGVVNQQITVIGTDFEGNGSATGADVSDNGDFNTYISILATSNNASVNLNANGTANNDLIFNGLFGPSGAGTPQGGAANGIPTPGAVFTGTCTQTGTITEMLRGVTVYVPYCAVHP